MLLKGPQIKQSFFVGNQAPRGTLVLSYICMYIYIQYLHAYLLKQPKRQRSTIRQLNAGTRL